MVTDRLADGRRIAQLLASELTGGVDQLERLSVTDADPDVEPTDDGALAYRVRLHESAPPDSAETTDPVATGAVDPEPIAEVYVQPDRARVEFRITPDVAAEVGQDQNLRVRPKAVHPPRTIVFVEDGAQVKWILPVFEAVVDAADAKVDDDDDTSTDTSTDGE